MLDFFGVLFLRNRLFWVKRFGLIRTSPSLIPLSTPWKFQCVPLAECNRDVSRHLEMNGISEDLSLNNEMKLLLARAGIVSLHICIVYTVPFH